MKKIIKEMACLIAVLLMLSACAPTTSNTKGAAEVSDILSGPTQNASAKIAFFAFDNKYQTEEGQEIWALITHFSGEKGIASNVYTVTDNDFETTVELAKKSGVELIILWGDTVGEQIQNNLPFSKETSFILLDAEKGMDLEKNSIAQIFSAEQSGWLAGYLAVKNGELNLASLSLPEATQEQKQSELGFLLGAQAAAEQLDLPEKSVCISVGDSTGEQTIQQQMEQFISQGVKTVYVPTSRTKLQELDSSVESDQFEYIFAEKEEEEEVSSKTILSIDKEIDTVVNQLLETWTVGEIPFGQEVFMGIPEKAFSFSVANTWAEVSVEEQMKEATEYFTQQNVLQKLYDEISVPYSQTQTLPLPNQLVLSRVEVILAPQEVGAPLSKPTQSKQDAQSFEEEEASSEKVAE